MHVRLPCRSSLLVSGMLRGGYRIGHSLKVCFAVWKKRQSLWFSVVSTTLTIFDLKQLIAVGSNQLFCLVVPMLFGDVGSQMVLMSFR